MLIFLLKQPSVSVTNCLGLVLLSKGSSPTTWRSLEHDKSIIYIENIYQLSRVDLQTYKQRKISTSFCSLQLRSRYSICFPQHFQVVVRFWCGETSLQASLARSAINNMRFLDTNAKVVRHKRQIEALSKQRMISMRLMSSNPS